MKHSSVTMTGPLAPYAVGFRSSLVARGYKLNTVDVQLRLMAQLSGWLEGQALPVDELTPHRADQFLEFRRAQGYTQLLSPLALSPLAEYLRQLDLVPAPELAPPTALDDLLGSYRRYLVTERALARSTVRSYLDVARLFLEARPDPHALELDELQPAEVTAFVLRECRERSRGSTEYIVTGVRALLRFLYVDGRIRESLAEVVPKAPGWRLRSLPRYLDAPEVDRLLKSCDRRTATGRRDFAILVLLVRLGLRCGEVANLLLSDCNWRAGEMVIRGKGRREERLPLPVDVGEAVVGWLQRGRPSSDCRYVFVRVHAPIGPMSAGAVGHVVLAASKRAGLEPVNAHRLRHTAATQMLRAGAALADVGQVLRHRSAIATASYAKVDHNSLALLAPPWPGATP